MVVRSRKQQQPQGTSGDEGKESDPVISSSEGTSSECTTAPSSASSSWEDVTTDSSVERPWPPIVLEAPDWPSNLPEKPEPLEKNPVRRILHWGPLIALGIVAFISAVTTHYVMMWWPMTSAGGFLHFSIFMLWNYMTLSNMLSASFMGGGLVPKKWLPPKNEHKKDLQFCKPCDGYKVPRSHHCSKCGRCVMKMDHHCPWINNCVGHRNHAYFCRFLASAIAGCIHAFVIHVICAYHLFHQGWYLRFGNGTEPLIHVTFWSLIALVAASAFSFGVTIGLLGLLFVQLKGIRRNKTGIEEYISHKAVGRYEDEEETVEGEWIYPYDLGWKRNFKEVLGTWDGNPKGNGVWWPVAEPCDQFTLTHEQLAQKEYKRRMARLVEITGDFAGGVFGSCRFGCRVFVCQPISEEARVKVSPGERWVITQGTRHWFYGHLHNQEEGPKGWFPRRVAKLLEDRPYS